MRAVPAVLGATIDKPAFRLATLVHLQRSDGTLYALTNWDRPLDVDVGGPSGSVVHSPARMEGITEFSAQINAPPDDAEVSILLSSVDFPADAVRKYFWEHATATIYYVEPDDLTEAWLHRKYYIGQVRIEGARIKFELMGPEKRLERPVGRPLTANCKWNFADPDTCKAPVTAPEWEAATTYDAGDLVQAVGGGLLRWFKAGGAGISGGSEPSWPGGIGGTVVDGGITWTAVGARVVIGTVTVPTDFRTFTASGINIAGDWFGEGRVTWLTGDNAGESRRVRSDSGTGVLVLHEPMLDPIAVGDTFEAMVGCRKRFTEDCVTKFDNAVHNMSFPFLAPENVTATANAGEDDED